MPIDFFGTHECVHSFFPAGVKAWPGVCERKQVSSSGPDGVTAPEARACPSRSALLSGHRGPFFPVVPPPPLPPPSSLSPPMTSSPSGSSPCDGVSFCRRDTVFSVLLVRGSEPGTLRPVQLLGRIRDLAGPGGADGLPSLERRPPLCLVSALWK